MDPVTAHVLIGRPREEVFDYLADIANHQEFSDHYLKEWRLTRVESAGRGAGARFKIDAPLDRFGWGDMTFIEVDGRTGSSPPGRSGKFNRNKTWTTWTLEPSGNSTRVEVTTESELGAADGQVPGGRDRPSRLVEARAAQGAAAHAVDPRRGPRPRQARFGRRAVRRDIPSAPPRSSDLTQRQDIPSAPPRSSDLR